MCVPSRSMKATVLKIGNLHPRCGSDREGGISYYPHAVMRNKLWFIKQSPHEESPAQLVLKMVLQCLHWSFFFPDIFIILQKIFQRLQYYGASSLISSIFIYYYLSVFCLHSTTSVWVQRGEPAVQPGRERTFSSLDSAGATCLFYCERKLCSTS